MVKKAISASKNGSLQSAENEIRILRDISKRERMARKELTAQAEEKNKEEPEKSTHKWIADHRNAKVIKVPKREQAQERTSFRTRFYRQ